MIVAFCVVTLLIRSQKDFCKKNSASAISKFSLQVLLAQLMLTYSKTNPYGTLTIDPFNRISIQPSHHSFIRLQHHFLPFAMTLESTFCFIPWTSSSSFSFTLFSSQPSWFHIHLNNVTVHYSNSFPLQARLKTYLHKSFPFHHRPRSHSTHRTIVAAFTESRLLDSFSSLSF